MTTPSWHNYQNFALWCQVEEGFNAEADGKRFNLDKDLIEPNNLVYGPTTCCFVPHAINTALVGKASGSVLPCGVYKSLKGEFVTHVSVGSGKVKAVKHGDPLSASDTYKNEKLRRIKECMKKYSELLSAKVRIALLDFNLDERLIYN